jgi:hypothetical protein
MNSLRNEFPKLHSILTLVCFVGGVEGVSARDGSSRAWNYVLLEGRS